MDVLYRIILFSAAVNNAWERRVCTPHLRSSLCPEPCWRPLLDILTCQECGSASEPPNYWPLLHEFPSALLPLSLPPSSLMHPVVFLFLVCALTVLLPLFCLCHVSLLLLFSPPPPPPHPLFVPPALLSSWFTVAPRLLQQVPDRLTDSSSVIFHFEWLIIVSAWFTALTLREALWYLQAAALMRSWWAKGALNMQIWENGRAAVTLEDYT